MELLLEFIIAFIGAIIECIPTAMVCIFLLSLFIVGMIITTEPWKYKNFKTWLKAVFKD